MSPVHTWLMSQKVQRFICIHVCFNFMVNSSMTNMFWAQSYDSSVRFNVNTEGLLSTMPAPLLPATTEGLLAIVLYSVYQQRRC